MERVMNVDNVEEVNNDDPMEMINEVDMDLDIDEMINIEMTEMQIVNHARQELERRQYIGAIVQLCSVVHALHLLEVLSTCLHSRVNNSPERDRWSCELMSRLVHGRWCRDVIRMSSETFLRLCQKLRCTGIVKDTIWSTVEEQVAKFLQIVGDNAKNSGMSFVYLRSGETVSRHFHKVLRAIISLEGEFLVQPSGSDVPPQILNKSIFYPFFKDCIGAIDGTYIRVKVPRAEAPHFRGRKEFPTQNVFAACDFDMKFTYVLASWEGTTSDSRILKDALSREDILKTPEGNFYIGDARFMLKRTLLTPYRGVRYHLKEYLARGPQNSIETFNHPHSSLRIVIERTFSVLKKRFPIISSGSEPHYSFETMRDIVLACCILHNFLRGVDDDRSLITEVDRELLQQAIDTSQTQQRDEDYREGELLRDSIASEIWNAYQV